MQACEQLELDLGPPAPEPPPIERLGESREFGRLLLDLLGLSGWFVAVTPGFAGGVNVYAARGPYEVRRTGESFAALASEVFEEALRLQRPVARV